MVEVVIGMEGPVTDRAALAFGFYRGLGYHASVGDAFAQAEATLDGKGLLGDDPAAAGRDIDHVGAARPGARPRIATRDGVDAAAVSLNPLEAGAQVPYGLSIVQSLDASAAGGLAGVATQLRDAVARLPLRATRAGAEVLVVTGM